MILNVVRVGLLRMRHDRVEILLTFVIPIAFFTIFAFIFDRQIGLGKSPRVDAALVDEDGTELSRQLIDNLAKQGALRVLSPDELEGGAFTTVEPARKLVEAGGLPLAIVVPRGWTASVTAAGNDSVNIRILADSSDPVATQVAASLIKEVANGLLAEREKSRIRGLSRVALRRVRNCRVSAARASGRRRSVRRRKGESRGVHVRGRNRGDVPLVRRRR